MASSSPNSLVPLGSLPLAENACSIINAFCTEDNIPQCVSYINQRLASLGLFTTCIETTSPGGAGLNAVPALNAIYELLQIHRPTMLSVDTLEKKQQRRSSTLDLTNSKLKDRMKLSASEKCGLHELKRHLQLKIKILQSSLKKEKDEVQKLQNIIASRASQYSHDSKRKEREVAKLKDHINQLLDGRRDKKPEVRNTSEQSDGKRGHCKITAKSTTSHEREMYKSLLSEYEASQKSLMLENAELKEVLQHMKKEMIHISHSSSARGASADDSQEQNDSAGEKTDTSKKTLDQSCEHVREQLTNSIRQQWRKLRNHVEKLNSQASQMQNQLESKETSLETQENVMERMRCEVQQCKEFIRTQQQLLQQLNTQFDGETATFLNDCYTLEEKERLKEEWRLFEEQKRNFEREKKNFAEAAIHLGREKKAFKKDRASWLNQFLDTTPFTDQRCSSSDGSEPEVRMSSVKGQTAKLLTYTIPKPSQTAVVPSATEPYRTLHSIPESSSSSYSDREVQHR